jgi:hypothetical protein
VLLEEKLCGFWALKVSWKRRRCVIWISLFNTAHSQGFHFHSLYSLQSFHPRVRFICAYFFIRSSVFHPCLDYLNLLALHFHSNIMSFFIIHHHTETIFLIIALRATLLSFVLDRFLSWADHEDSDDPHLAAYDFSRNDARVCSRCAMVRFLRKLAREEGKYLTISTLFVLRARRMSEVPGRA